MKVVIAKNGEDDELPCVIGVEREGDETELITWVLNFCILPNFRRLRAVLHRDWDDEQERRSP